MNPPSAAPLGSGLRMPGFRAGSPPANQRPALRQRGLSLIELIGVMAVMAILLLALVPSLQKQAEIKFRTGEASALKTIIEGLRTHVITDRRIPDASTFATEVASEIGWLLSDLTTNALGNPRVYLVDPALRIGPFAFNTLPYVQGTNGSLLPASPRVMVVSSLSTPLPSSITAVAATNASTFEQVWSAADGVAPSGWTGGGNWPDIMIQRLNLAPLFIPVILNNNPTAGPIGRYSIDNTNTHVTLPSVPFSAYFIVGTALGLHATSGDLQARLVLQDFPLLTNNSAAATCPSFVYEKGVWRGRLFMSTDGQKHNGLDLQAACDIFLSGVENNYHTTLTQMDVVMGMWYYMSNYVRWANNGFASSYKTALNNSQNTMASRLGEYCDKKASN